MVTSWAWFCTSNLNSCRGEFRITREESTECLAPPILFKAPWGTTRRKSHLFWLRTARTSRQEKMRGLPEACVKWGAHNDGRARKKRRGTRFITNAVFCLDCRKQQPVTVHTKNRCSSCQYICSIDDKRKRRLNWERQWIELRSHATTCRFITRN